MVEEQAMVGGCGIMQVKALNTSSVLDHAARNHSRTEIIGIGHDGVARCSTWKDLRERALRVAAAAGALGLIAGDRVATLAWNRLPHLELYYGLTGCGLILHTINPRLASDHLEYVLRHGGARMLCIEPDLLQLLESIPDALRQIEQVIVLCDRAGLPADSRFPYVAYEEWLSSTQPLTAWPEVEENAGSTLCYTSGTTGNPKGVLYSHRSIVLHAMSACMADSMGLSARDTVALLTPLFHVNGWGVPFAAAMCGARLLLPGSALAPQSLFQLMATEQATFALGVPTVWMNFIEYLHGLPKGEATTLSLNRVFVGGATPPASLVDEFREVLGVDLIQAWGMTETSPVMTVNTPLAHQQGLRGQERTSLQVLQGRTVFGAEIRIVDERGNELPWDGTASGFLQVRGHWVLKSYHDTALTPAVDAAGWFDTGDIAQITSDGFLRITDRAKDMIKSGGEWISSIDLENAAHNFDGIAEAAVIAADHPIWQERPLMLVRMRTDARLDKDALLKHLAARVAKWWLPDDILAVADLPHGATGKLLKSALREKYGRHLLETGK